MSKTVRKVLVLMTLALVAVIVFSVINLGVAGQVYPSIHPSVLPDPKEVTKIEGTIKNSYSLEGAAARSFDTSDFSSVFLNGPDTKLDSQSLTNQKAYCRKRPDLPCSNGMLDFKLDWYGYWQQSAEAYEKLQATAEAKGEDPSDDDVQAINDGKGPIPRRTDPLYEASLQFQDVKVDGDRAEVTFDDGAVQKLYLMKKTPQGWKIAGFRYLKVHG